MISIHAPREGGDLELVDTIVDKLIISIHAPREGGDIKIIAKVEGIQNFNPRPPRGGRPEDQLTKANAQLFQSTPPARGAT